MSIFSLSEVPGYVDVPDSLLGAEKLASAYALQAQLGNAKFGMARIECFRYFLRDGDEVELPTSPIDGYKYTRRELLYHWCFYMTANPDDGRTSAPGNILLLDAKVEQWGDDSPGKVHCAVWYHMQGGVTTPTNDGLLTVTVIAQRGIGSLAVTGLPTAAFPGCKTDSDNIDAAYTELRAQAFNQNAKLGVVSTEYFYVGEFKHGDRLDASALGGAKTVTLISPIDGYEYDHGQDAVIFMYSWRHTANPCSNKAGYQSGGDACGQGGFWGTIREFHIDVLDPSTEAVQLRVVYYRKTVFAASTKTTNDGLVAVFALARRGTVYQGGVPLIPTSPSAFVEQDPSDFLPCEPLTDGALNRLGANIRQAQLRPELPNFILYPHAPNGSAIPAVTYLSGQAYSTSENKFFIWERTHSDYSESIPDGALLSFRNFVKNNGVVSIDTQYWEPDGQQTNVNTGVLFAVQLAFRYGNGDPPEPNDLGKTLGSGRESPTVYTAILSADGIESATYVEADTAPLFLPAETPDFAAIITLRANGAAAALRGASGYIQITDGVTPVNSNVATIGDVDSGQATLNVDAPPTGAVTINLFLKKENAGSWTGNVGATVKVPQGQGAA